MKPVAVGRLNQKERNPWGRIIIVFFGYSLLIFVLQSVIIRRLPWTWAQANLMVAVCTELVGRIPLIASIPWGFFWGYVGDVFQGRPWGVHCGTYLGLLFLHRLWSAQMDMSAMVYRVLLAGFGVMIQNLGSAVIVGGLSDPGGSLRSTAGQVIFSIFTAPFVMIPIQWILGEKET